MKNNHFSEDKLNTLDRSELIQLILSQQEELKKMDERLQLFMEEVADANRRRFGRSTEQLQVEGQLSFFETGDLAYLNEAEAVVDEDHAETPVLSVKRVRPKGKKAADLSKLEVVKETSYYMSEKELEEVFGKEGYKRLPDEIIKRCFPLP